MERQQLYEKIDKQNERLQKYEEKTKDLIVAYKALFKEKEILQQTIKTLTEKTVQQKDSSKDSALEGGAMSESSLNCTKDGKEDGPLDAAAQNSSSDLQDKIDALTLSIAALNEEKTRMETTFQKDKKKTREHYDAIIARLTTELDSEKIVRTEFSNQVTQLKRQLDELTQLMDRKELEMNRKLLECQTELSNERSAKQSLELKTQSMREEMSELESAAQKQERLDAALRQEKQAKRDAKRLAREAEESGSRLVECRTRLTQCEEEVRFVRASLEAERQSAAQSQLELESCRSARESDLAQYEERISRLANKMRAEETSTIEAGKEKQAGNENENNNENVNHNNAAITVEDDNAEMLVFSLADAERHVRTLIGRLLRLAANNHDNTDTRNEDEAENVSAILARVIGAELHQRFVEEIKSCLRNEQHNQEDEGNSASEHQQQQHQQQNDALRQANQNQTRQLEELRSQLEAANNRLAQHEQSANETRKRLESQLERVKRESRDQMCVLQSEHDSYRRRMADLLDKQEQEVAATSTHTHTSISASSPSSFSLSTSETSSRTRIAAALNTRSTKPTGIAAVYQGGSGASNAVSAGAGTNMENPFQQNCSLFQCSEMKARLKQDLIQLQKQKRSVELELRESDANRLALRAELDEIACVYKAQIGRAAQVVNGTEMLTNLEYLKNVVMRFMLTSRISSSSTESAASCLGIVRAIAAVLHFTPTEIAKVERYLNLK